MNAIPGFDSPADSGVVIVTEVLAPNEHRDTVRLRERYYGAHLWEVKHYEGPRGEVAYLQIFKTGTTQPIASYAAGMWASVRYEGAIVPDANARALEHATKALGNLRVQLTEDTWQLDHTSLSALIKRITQVVEQAQADIESEYL